MCIPSSIEIAYLNTGMFIPKRVIRVHITIAGLGNSRARALLSRHPDLSARIYDIIGMFIPVLVVLGMHTPIAIGHCRRTVRRGLAGPIVVMLRHRPYSRTRRSTKTSTRIAGGADPGHLPLDLPRYAETS